MSELTQEKFEQILDKKFDEKLKDLATKQGVQDAVDNLARIVNSGFEDVASQFQDQQTYLERLDNRLDIVEHKVDSKFTRLESALHIKL